jgi:hypothetical protein
MSATFTLTWLPNATLRLDDRGTMLAEVVERNIIEDGKSSPR